MYNVPFKILCMFPATGVADKKILFTGKHDDSGT